jgi:FkbM family methyltransferase
MTSSGAIEWVLDHMAGATRRLPPVRGRGALAQAVQRRLGPTVSGTWAVKLAGELTVQVPRSSEQGWVPAFTGRYEPATMHLADRMFLPSTFCLDLGACFGLFAVPLGRMARQRGGVVIAFEPVPENHRWLMGNVRQNGLDDVIQVYGVGLSNVGGQATMRTEVGGGGNAVILRDDVEPTDVTIQVDLVRLDDLTLDPEARGMRCSFVKMDMEGFELFALEGAERFITRHRPAIFGEFNSKFMADHGLGSRDIARWAERHRYEVFRVGRRRMWTLGEAQTPVVQPVPPDHHGKWTDLLMLPEEQEREMWPA